MRPALLLLVWICAYAAYQNGWLDVCAKPLKIKDKIGSKPGNFYKAGFYTVSKIFTSMQFFCSSSKSNIKLEYINY